MVDVDRVVGRLVELVEYSHFALCLYGSCEYGSAEVVLCNYL